MNAGEAPVIGMTDTYYAPGTYQLDVRPWACPPWWSAPCRGLRHVLPLFEEQAVASELKQ